MTLTMKLQMDLHHFFTVVLLSYVTAHGQGIFLEKHKPAIQNYIMTGHESGWHHCDILSGGANRHEGAPQRSMDLHKIKTLNIKSAFASSHCLLANYQVSNEASLSALLNFGWAAIQHVRLAIVLKMGPGITLNLASNTTKLPFLVAAESDEGQEQFLCPVIGEKKPRFEKEMCKPSYTSCKNRTLRIGITGIRPYFVFSKLGYDGVEIRALKMLEKQFNFNTKLFTPVEIVATTNLVCIMYDIFS